MTLINRLVVNVGLAVDINQHRQQFTYACWYRGMYSDCFFKLSVGYISIDYLIDDKRTRSFARQTEEIVTRKSWNASHPRTSLLIIPDENALGFVAVV